MSAKCSICHRPLTDPYSIAVGMGPECRGAAAKKGMIFPKAMYRISHGRVIFDGLEKTEPLNAKEKDEDRRMKDEKKELVLRIKYGGGNTLDAIEALHDYMHEKDSPVTRQWCKKFVWKIWKEEV